MDVTVHFEGGTKQRVIKNLLKETIFGATQEIRKRLGEPWLIVTVPGVGYRIDATPVGEVPETGGTDGSGADDGGERA